MKTDNAALFWGTLVGVTLVAGMCVLAFDFPHFRVPHPEEWIGFLLVTLVLFSAVVRAYRKLWKRVGFWLLLVAFIPAHAWFWWSFILRQLRTANLLRESASYMIGGGLEVLAFALIVYAIYHKGPDAHCVT